jgi:hypothetical protein
MPGNEETNSTRAGEPLTSDGGVLPKQIVARSSKAMQPLQRLAARGAQGPGPAAAEAVLDLGFDPEDWAPMDVVMIFVGSMCNRFSDFNTDANAPTTVPQGLAERKVVGPLAQRRSSDGEARPRGWLDA